MSDKTKAVLVLVNELRTELMCLEDELELNRAELIRLQAALEKTELRRRVLVKTIALVQDGNL